MNGHQANPANRTTQKLDSLYAECMNCPNTVTECPGIWKDIADGLPPRGFHYEAAPVDVLAVAKNPGHPFSWERDGYRGHRGTALLEAYQSFKEDFYSRVQREKGHTFHKNLFRYLSLLLDVDETEVYQRAAHTNLVKCSTRAEQDRLQFQTMEECYRRYFRHELALLAPKVLLALGREAAGFLHSHEWEWGIPVIYIRHPSVYYPRDEEEEILAEIKHKVQHAIELGEA